MIRTEAITAGPYHNHKTYVPHSPASGCAQHWRSAVALDDNPDSKATYGHRHVETRKRKRTNGWRRAAIVSQHEGKPVVCRALTKRCRERYDTEQDFYGI